MFNDYPMNNFWKIKITPAYNETCLHLNSTLAPWLLLKKKTWMAKSSMSCFLARVEVYREIIFYFFVLKIRTFKTENCSRFLLILMKNSIVLRRKLINMEHLRHPLKSFTKITTQNILINLSQHLLGSKEII